MFSLRTTERLACETKSYSGILGFTLILKNSAYYVDIAHQAIEKYIYLPRQTMGLVKKGSTDQAVLYSEKVPVLW